jgi:hypothetical protein
MLTDDRSLPLSAAASAASSFPRLLWLNVSEPLSAGAAAALLLAGAAALLLALLAGVLAAADDELLLDEEEHAVSAARAPMPTARPAANFLFIHDLLVLLLGGQGTNERVHSLP